MKKIGAVLDLTFRRLVQTILFACQLLILATGIFIIYATFVDRDTINVLELRYESRLGVASIVKPKPYYRPGDVITITYSYRKNLALEVVVDRMLENANDTIKINRTYSNAPINSSFKETTTAIRVPRNVCSGAYIIHVQQTYRWAYIRRMIYDIYSEKFNIRGDDDCNT